MSKPLIQASIFLVGMLLLPSCGPGKGDVSGTVHHKGKPLAGGTITYFDANNATSSSVIKEDGSYLVRQVTAGQTRITIVMPLAISMPGMPARESISIPPKYADPEQSGLTYTVVTGPQTHNLTLE